METMIVELIFEPCNKMCIGEAGNQLDGQSWNVKLTNLFVHNYFASHVFKICN